MGVVHDAHYNSGIFLSSAAQGGLDLEEKLALGSEMKPGKGVHTRTGTLHLASGHGRYGKWPLSFKRNHAPTRGHNTGAHYAMFTMQLSVKVIVTVSNSSYVMPLCELEPACRDHARRV